MNKLPTIIAAFFLANIGLFAQVPTNRISLTISITNAPVTSNTIVVNADTRTWTNASTASTILTNLISTAQSATNLYNQIANFPYSGGIFPQWLTETSIVLRAPLGGALSASQSGDWAVLTLSTQSGPLTFTALWPLENIPTATNRTNQGSAFVYGLSTFSTQAFATNSTAVSNLLNKGASPLQRVDGPVTFGGQVGIAISSQTNVSLYNATNRGYIVAITNGYWTNGIADKLITTNATNYGLAFSSPGAYPRSQQFGGGNVSAGGSLAIGEGSAAGTNSVAIGYLASAGHYSVALGTGSDASAATNGVAIGQNTSLGASSNAVALGQGANVGDRHHGSIALGKDAATTTNLQVMLGSSSHTTVVPGMLAISGTQTNTTFTGTNVLNGRVDATPRNNTALANGYNSAVVFGTNLVVRFSGPSGAYTNAGFLAPGGPQIVWGQFDNPGLSFTILDESGLEATAANRIITGTGALLNSTNRVVLGGFLYDTTSSRWRVISFR